jgi:hypothetical protein
VAVGTDPRYRTLATLAAGEIGAPATHDVLVAITAQWQCEQPASAWPPVHNNPGFVTSGAMHSVGEPASSATTAPGKGFLAQYATPEDGSRAYGRLIAKGSRYQTAQTLLTRGDGPGFLKAITAAGYGTRYSCCIAAYKANGGANVGTAPTGTLAGFITNDDLADQLAALLGVSRSAILTNEQVLIAARWLSDNGYEDETQAQHELKGNTLDAWAKMHAAGGPLDPIAGAIAGIGDAIGQGVAAIGAAIAHGLFLLTFLLMILFGLYVIATSSDTAEGT